MKVPRPPTHGRREPWPTHWTREDHCGRDATLADYLAARAQFATAAGARNWRYLDFQLWQEGVARWTEIELGRRHPDPTVRDAADALEHRTLATLRSPDLAKQGRELAYPLGAGEAMLLESCAPGWRGRYLSVLGLTPLLASLHSCKAG